MPAVHIVELHFALPANLSSEIVIQHLQACEPLITVSPYLISYTRKSTNMEDVVSDPFFSDDDQKIDSFVITDRIPVMGLSKKVKVPAIFQAFASGVRVRADGSGGVRVWSTYSVERREGVVSDPESGDWELVERSRVECNAILKPFVVKSFDVSHGTNCQRFIDNLKRKTAA